MSILVSGWNSIPRAVTKRSRCDWNDTVSFNRGQIVSYKREVLQRMAGNTLANFCARKCFLECTSIVLLYLFHLLYSILTQDASRQYIQILGTNHNIGQALKSLFDTQLTNNTKGKKFENYSLYWYTDEGRTSRSVSKQKITKENRKSRIQFGPSKRITWSLS